MLLKKTWCLYWKKGSISWCLSAPFLECWQSFVFTHLQPTPPTCTFSPWPPCSFLPIILYFLVLLYLFSTFLPYLNKKYTHLHFSCQINRMFAPEIKIKKIYNCCPCFPFCYVLALTHHSSSPSNRSPLLSFHKDFHSWPPLWTIDTWAHTVTMLTKLWFQLLCNALHCPWDRRRLSKYHQYKNGK